MPEAAIEFAKDAHWVWSPDATRPYHNVVCFRRVIRCDSPPSSGTIRITADARYRLLINGHWLGDGPARAWASPWSADEFDIAPLLHADDNVVAVIVEHFGLSNFQYLHGEPGLLPPVARRQ